MHEAVTLLLAGFSTRIREGTAVSALTLLLHFLLVFRSTVTILVVARADLVLKYKGHRLPAANSKRG